jgi:hypothetical protein
MGGLMTLGRGAIGPGKGMISAKFENEDLFIAKDIYLQERGARLAF